MRAVSIATLVTVALLGAARAGETRTTMHWATFMRAGPGANFGTIDEIDGGESITLLGCEANWCAIRVAGHTGYVMSDALNLPALPRRGTVPGENGTQCFRADAAGWWRPVPQRFCRSQP